MQTNNNSASTKKNIWRRWFLAGILVLALGINGAGLYIGDIIYQETSVSHTYWNKQNTSAFKQRLATGSKEKQWEDIVIESRFDYPLRGTYIPNPQPTTKTLIFLHGFTESRAIGLHYLDIYLNAGFNLLLIDSRAHGNSGGSSVTWGIYERYDLDQWVNWLYHRFPEGIIGVHGNSMGAATALMHAELNETNKRVAFYIADSSYSDLESLLTLQIEQRLALSGMSLPKLLLQYANVVAYFNSRFTFHQASPIRSVVHVTTPILYIHGEDDQLVPAYMSLDLYNATKGPRQIYMAPHASHVSAIFEDHDQYDRAVRNFVHSLDLPG